MSDELFSQFGVPESMLSEGSSVSTEIHSAIDAMEARIHGFLAGQQYESDMHRDMRDNYDTDVDGNSCINELISRRSYMSDEVMYNYIRDYLDSHEMIDLLTIIIKVTDDKKQKEIEL